MLSSTSGGPQSPRCSLIEQCLSNVLLLPDVILFFNSVGLILKADAIK